ncbi:hypothetical protein KAJ27_00390 [bacterium]|nr:hypothetical protein [bacterium]
MVLFRYKSGIVIIITVCIFIFSGCCKQNMEAEKNPWEYDVTKFKQADPEKILFKEEPSLKDVKDKINGLAINSKDIVFYCAGNLVAGISPEGKQLYSFTVEAIPTCISVSDHDEIYLGMGDYVEVYDTSGKSIKKITLDRNAIITSMALYKNEVAIADAGGKQVWIFTNEGRLLRIIGENRTSNRSKSFIVPSRIFDLDFDKEGKLWIVNPGKLRIERYSDTGNMEFYFGKASMNLSGFMGCCNPAHISVSDVLDGIITSEKGIVRIKYYSKTGIFKGIVAGPQDFSEDTTGLFVCINSKGRVFVADSSKKKIRIFTLKQER